MKKVLLILALILTLSAACLAFTACGEDDGISFKTFEVSGTNVYGRVSKDKEIFEFTNEIKVSGNAKYVVALDALGMQTVATKTVSLNEGDNTFYIIEMVNDEATAVYTVVIHRIEVYEVSFDTAGNGAIKTQYIEEGFFATAPTANFTTRLGYEFLGWDFDFTKPITGDVVVKAKIELKDEMKNFKFTSTTTSCEITGLYDKTVTELVIPDYVTSIGWYAFYDCDSLTSVYITDIAAWCNISFGGYNANPLYYANNLYLNGILVAELVIPDSVTSIGDYAFSGCDSLTSVTIPNSVTSIGDWAFYGCDSLTSVTIGNSVTSIGDNAFFNCDSLTSVTIPDGVTSIGDDAFYSCTSLTSVTIPDSVTSIGSSAFAWCYGLKSITIPDSVTSIGDYAFRGCTSLTIYCEAASMPSGWNSEWNYSGRPIAWGYRG